MKSKEANVWQLKKGRISTPRSAAFTPLHELPALISLVDTCAPASRISKRRKRRAPFEWASRKKPAAAQLAAVALALLAGNSSAAGQTATVSLVPDADTFVRSLAPTSNYGGGGALSVSGSAAVNGSGVQQGLFDTLMRFPMSNVVTSLESSLGGDDWIITTVTLVVTEMAAPDNAIFNLGVGAFEVRWLGSNTWLEGSGKPIAPTSDGVAWQDVPSLLNENTDLSLGQFTNSGLSGLESFGLALPERFVQAVRSGGEVSFYLTARSPEVGFTFNSREFGNTNAQPKLEISAAANPKPRIDSIEVLGTNATVRFGTISNWSYILQGTDGLPGEWSSLLAVAAQPTNGQVVFIDAATSGQKFYRLSVSQ